jgi:hypothetical protein
MTSSFAHDLQELDNWIEMQMMNTSIPCDQRRTEPLNTYGRGISLKLTACTNGQTFQFAMRAAI